MSEYGELSDYCITRFSFNDATNNVTIELTGTIPPYECYTIICDGVIVVRFNKVSDTQSPYFCGQFFWKNCKTEINKTLADIQYPFYNKLPTILDNIIVPKNNCIYLHFEGDVCGDIICSKIQKK